MEIQAVLAEEFHLQPWQVAHTVSLIDDGNTIPFIARYRKEATGSLDDQVLRSLSDRLDALRKLEKRKQEVVSLIAAQGALTEALQQEILAAKTLAEVDDLYRPYRPKRKTRASAAKEKGLEPLAKRMLEQSLIRPHLEAEAFLSAAVPSVAEALQGAVDILAEQIADDALLRKQLRSFVMQQASLQVKATDPEAQTVYQQYHSFCQPLRKLAGYQVLAINRGERESQLKVTVTLPEAQAKQLVRRAYVTAKNEAAELVAQACDDGFDRLLFPSLEREIRSALTERASQDAIRVFSENLRQLLLQPPVKGAVTLGFDPAYRTGCKIAVVDDTGKVLDTAVIYPTPPQHKTEQAKQCLKRLIQTYGVTVIAIGNGTASRESEQFVAELLRELPQKVSYMVVSEAGASVYSASKLAAEEFPQFDVSLRSAVSIARRLQDPLAELVKIDPKAIGVGQYQHDMPKAQLNAALNGVVEDCVNSVGVDLNTASEPLLARVSGIHAGLAASIVSYREEQGAFAERKQLLQVPKLGKKAYEQSAGFLRISQGNNPLDNTAVHPESYPAAVQLLRRCGYRLNQLDQGLQDLPDQVEQIGWTVLSRELGIGVPTLKDIVQELIKPGRDPRDQLPPPQLRSDVMELSDLRRGMELKGTVRNVIDFGAFVDIGVHEDGLVHISQLSRQYVRHPLDIVKVGDVVTVWVLDVDLKRKRISLTMKGRPAESTE